MCNEFERLINAHAHFGAKREGGRATGSLIIPRQFLKSAMVHPFASK
jgi:hypothetical protein